MKLSQKQLRELICEEAGFEKEVEQHHGSLEQLQHELHEIMEAMISQHGEQATSHAVMKAWTNATEEVASGVDKDDLT